MISLHVDSLFANIPLEETINICTNLLYNNEDVIEGIKKSEFKNLLSLATQESYFIFNDVLYKQNDSVAMGSPLGPPMANVFLSFYEVKWLEQCPKEFKQFFTEDMLMTFLFSSNRLNTSLILVIQTCLSTLNRRKMESCHLLI